MPISQQTLGRLVHVSTRRWAFIGAAFWLTMVLAYVTLGVLDHARGKSLSPYAVFWLVLSVVCLIKDGIALTWHRRERAADRRGLK